MKKHQYIAAFALLLLAVGYVANYPVLIAVSIATAVFSFFVED